MQSLTWKNAIMASIIGRVLANVSDPLIS